MLTYFPLEIQGACPMCQSFTIQNVFYRYPSQIEPVFHAINLHFSPGWTGIVGKNGSGKSTLAKLITREILPDNGKILGSSEVSYLSQGTEITEEELFSFLYEDSHQTGFWKSLLQIKIQTPEHYEWQSLGEKRRTKLAIALSKETEVLILDEPTNHLDAHNREIIRNAMFAYKGIGILISHDRTLLDDLIHSCVFLDPPHAAQRPGTYSDGKREIERERKETLHKWEIVKAERKQLEKEWKKRKEEARLSHKHRSKKGLDLHDHDGRGKINLARVSGKDGQAGRLTHQMERRTERLRIQEMEILNSLSKKETIGISFKDVSFVKKTYLSLDEDKIHFEFLTFSLEGSFHIHSESKIAITGNNGGGKSTLLQFLAHQLERKAISTLYLPQEFSKEDLRKLSKEFQTLSEEKKANVLSAIHRLGSDPKQFLASERLSPGEGKKLFLALHLEETPEVVLLDEPTNHLDLNSVEALETSLSRLGQSLVVVSHDRTFLQRIAKEEWVLENLRLTQKHLDRI